ncbi:MAG: IclR family transcriptional regulator [Ottowia sp.]|jgi:IclR family pca regulon transcriptional regulator|nr:IclR family transcriptional regulator [Ottowia sp.]MBP7452796.1 IclR family transcriptional regulator [Ottowia sp.]
MARRKTQELTGSKPVIKPPKDAKREAPAPSLREEESGLFVASVAKAFDVLRIISTSPEPLGLTDTAKLTNMGRSAVQRFLHTLTTLGYLHQDPGTRCYSVTPQVLGLAQGFLGANGLQRKASALLRAANLECEETLNFSVLDKSSVLYLVRYPGKHPVSVELSVGSRLPVHSSAAGRVMLAFMDEREAGLLLAKSERTAFTPSTETHIENFLASFPATRRLGYYASNQEGFVGDISIAAPVFGHGGGLVGAVNIAVSTSCWAMEDAEAQLAPYVVRVARQLSASLGYTAPESGGIN